MLHALPEMHIYHLHPRFRVIFRERAKRFQCLPSAGSVGVEIARSVGHDHAQETAGFEHPQTLVKKTRHVSVVVKMFEEMFGEDDTRTLVRQGNVSSHVGD